MAVVGFQVRAQPLAAVHGDQSERSRLDVGAAPSNPALPEYVSAHTAACAASFEILAGVLGDTAFAMETLTAPEGMPSRQFPSFHDAVAECTDSRVRLGWHFRYATDAGLVLGRSVATHVVEHYLTGR